MKAGPSVSALLGSARICYHEGGPLQRQSQKLADPNERLTKQRGCHLYEWGP